MKPPTSIDHDCFPQKIPTDNSSPSISKDNQVLVTIIVPAYNEEAVIESNPVQFKTAN